MDIKGIIKAAVNVWVGKNPNILITPSQSDCLIATLTREFDERSRRYGIPKDLPQSEIVIPNYPKGYVRRCF